MTNKKSTKTKVTKKVTKKKATKPKVAKKKTAKKVVLKTNRTKRKKLTTERKRRVTLFSFIATFFFFGLAIIAWKRNRNVLGAVLLALSAGCFSLAFFEVDYGSHAINLFSLVTFLMTVLQNAMLSIINLLAPRFGKKLYRNFNF